MGLAQRSSHVSERSCGRSLHAREEAAATDVGAADEALAHAGRTRLARKMQVSLAAWRQVSALLARIDRESVGPFVRARPTEARRRECAVEQFSRSGEHTSELK